MGIKIERWLAKVIIIGLLGFVSIIVYRSFTQEIIETKAPVIVSENMSNLEIDDDKPLQIVAREEIDNIKGLNQFIGAIGDNEIIARIGLGRSEIEELYKKNGKHMGAKEETDFINAVGGQWFKIELATLEKEPLNTEEIEFNASEGSPTVSPDGRKLIHIPFIMDKSVDSDKRTIIYDLHNKSFSDIDFLEDVIFKSWSQDSRYILGISRDDHGWSIVVFGVENNEIRKIKINDNEIKMISLGHIFSEDGKIIYFVGRKNGVDGICKLDTDSERIEFTMTLPGKANLKDFENYIINYGYRVIENGNRIVFVGNINGEMGLYIYNGESKEFTKVAESVGDPVVLFWISPDNKKIIYATHSKGNEKKGFWNVYAAKIVGNELENKMQISQNIEYPGMPIAYWSTDSRRVLMYEPKIFSLDGRVFVEKAIIRKIRFK